MSSGVATFATIFFSMILVNNYVLVQFLGICPFLGVSKKLDSSVGMGLAVIAVMFIATAVTFPLQMFLLDKEGLAYMQTIIFILVIAVLVQLIEITLKRYIPALYKSLGVYLPLITTNCVVLNVCLVNITSAYSFTQMLAYSIGTPLGFALVLYIFSAIRERLEISSVPKPFAGNPIAMIVAAIMAMAFSAFAGLV